MTNYRYSGYLLVALGLLNFRYHTGHPHNFEHSALITIPGLLILGSTFIPKAKPILLSKAGILFVSLIVLAGVIWAGVNK